MEDNKMGTMPVRQLILHMSWPMMISMFIQALYNMVDSIFVARINEDAFLALSLVYPFQTLMIAICVGTGVGVNAMLSRRLGQGRPQEAGAVGVNGLFLYGLTWLAFLAVGLALGRPFMALFSAPGSQVYRYGVEYLTIVSTCSIGMCMQFATERIMQATGNPKGPMLVQGIGAVVNLVLDPLFIFQQVGPLPGLGLEVTGAALATVLGQLIGMVTGFLLLRQVKHIKLTLRGFRPDPRAIGDIYRIGVPAMVMQSLATLMVMGLNKILGLFSQMDVVILGAYFKLQSFLFMPIFGLTNGLVPVLSYNYGARRRRRILDGVHFSVLVGLVLLTTGMVILLLLAPLFISFFSEKETTRLAGEAALRVVALSFPFAALSIVFSSVFQALAQPRLSLLISLLRQLVVILPAAFLLCLLDHNLCWWAFPLAEVVSAVTALLFYRWVAGKKLSAFPD